MSEPQDGRAVLDRIKPQRRVEWTELCLRPDLLSRHEELNAELIASQVKDAGGRLVDGNSKRTKDLAKKLDALEQEIQSLAVRFTFRAMSKDEWQALCDNHPPRANNQMDLMAGYNLAAVQDDAIRKCLVDPVFDDASWRELLDVINPSEWAELRDMVTEVNRSVVEPPKSELASRILTRRANASASPNPGESAPAGSTAGSRKKSTSTTTQTET